MPKKLVVSGPPVRPNLPEPRIVADKRSMKSREPGEGIEQSEQEEPSTTSPGPKQLFDFEMEEEKEEEDFDSDISETDELAFESFMSRFERSTLAVVRCFIGEPEHSKICAQSTQSW